VFTTYPVSSLQFREVAEDFRNPMVQKWNVAVQQDLGHSMALEVGYQGNTRRTSFSSPTITRARTWPP